MSRPFQLVFLLFYIGSSYAITQERTSVQADQVRHSCPKGEHTQIHEHCKHLAHQYPNYREAKPKTGCDLYFWPRESVHLRPCVSERGFHPQTYSFKSLATLRTILLRGPPLANVAPTVGAVIEDVNELKSRRIPLLASPQGGVAASSIKCRAATKADAAGVVFLLSSIGKPPRPRISGCFATFYYLLGHPSLR